MYLACVSMWKFTLQYDEYCPDAFVCWSLTSLCHSNGHIETMPAREINPFTALTRIRSQFLRTQWSTSNHSEWTRIRLRPLSHRDWLSWCDTIMINTCMYSFQYDEYCPDVTPSWLIHVCIVCSMMNIVLMRHHHD